MKRKMQLQNSSCTEWTAVPYFMWIQPTMACCFLFLPAIYIHRHPSCTSCVPRLVPRRFHVAPCVPSPSLEQVRRARGRFVTLKLRSTQCKNGRCCWLEWSSINRNPRPSLSLLRLGFFEIKGEHGILKKMCKGPPFLNCTLGCMFCPAAVILYRRVWVSPLPALF